MRIFHPVATALDHHELLDANLRFYDPLWSESRLVSPERFNTWPLVRSLVREGAARLEVAPGLRPRLPIEGTRFVDASEPAVAKLRQHGADAIVGLASALPFADATFDLVAAFDVVEHVDDDERALSELARVAAPGARVLLSAPLHATKWTAFDELVGHGRRYDPGALLARLGERSLVVERSAEYGMAPRSKRLVDFAVWGLTHRRKRATWLYDRVLMPVAALFQGKLVLKEGAADVASLDEVLLVLRRE